jgi:ferritin-like metal-binding protein YciE
MKEYKGTDALSAGLATSGQAVEHYEMAGYGILRIWATEPGMADAAKLLDRTLREEKAADELLTRLATARRKQKSGVIWNFLDPLRVCARPVVRKTLSDWLCYA